MRRVRRKYTAKTVPRRYQPRAPWTFKGEYPTGAPRVCRSIVHWDVEMPGQSGMVTVGVIDTLLHLYSHWGLTPHSVLVKIDDVWTILYDLEAEWPVVIDSGFWIEFVNDSQEFVARISREDAQRFGHQIEHGSRPKWAVPLNHYEIHRRSA